jgi:short-subunit dehydrogenase
MTFENKIIWITGASSGIGEALTYELIKRKAVVLISARREQELQRVRNNCGPWSGFCHIYPMDLTNDHEIKDVSAAILAAFSKIDILIHNGGISQRSLLAETPVEVDRKIMDINFFGAVMLTKSVLPAMILQKQGHIVVISSITGKFGFPLRSAYSASKHALHGFFETLRTEHIKDHINVTIVCPGRVHTNISLHAMTKDGLAHGVMDHGQEGGIAADKCAREILKAVAGNKKEVLIGREELLMVYIKRYFPWLFYKLVSRVQPR